ncbi:MAG: hypothetical protein HC862_18745 [Scytonema sp. RU_4_4]|nr:hypothetical protein [Scytonema sp. RU_4_4]NJR73321.1 hypothetical protein [Scytonema sp. CRU_2_7]
MIETSKDHTYGTLISQAVQDKICDGFMAQPLSWQSFFAPVPVNRHILHLEQKH